MERPTKITFGDMREQGGSRHPDLLRYRCSHSLAIRGDAWPD